MGPGKDAKGALAHTVTVTIDDHETVLTFFESKEDAEQFAQVERAESRGSWRAERMRRAPKASAALPT